MIWKSFSAYSKMGSCPKVHLTLNYRTAWFIKAKSTNWENLRLLLLNQVKLLFLLVMLEQPTQGFKHYCQAKYSFLSQATVSQVGSYLT